MANAKITALDALTAPIATDVLAIVDNPGGTPITKKVTAADLFALGATPPNLLKNGNFINNSTDGYGGTPDDWTSSSANPVQGGIPTLTKAELISILGVSDGDIEGLWPLNEASGNALDLSSSGYDLTETGGTIAADNDGLMATARDFETGDTEYFTIAHASAGNLEITGSQTWFAFIKPETATASPRFLSKGVNARELISSSVGSPTFIISGLATNEFVISSVKTEADKWYLIIGVYDSVAEKIKVWVNGIKTELTASGAATGNSNAFDIGRPSGTGSNYYDGLMQNACILSTALSDDQVKRLWAYTSYKGQKIRRDSTDALLYQDLPEDLVARLRGKTVTLRARVHAESTNHRIYIYDGTDTEAVSPASADAWEDISVTATIGATATQIRIGLEADTTDGNMWVEQVALYEGSSKLPYDHSKDDWSEFSELLKLTPFDVASGYKNKNIVKISVLRQNHTTNAYKNNSIILTGWGWVLASGGTAYHAGAVTFGITFDDRPIVVVSSPGYKATTDPTHIGDFTHNGGSNLIVASPQDIATTGFNPVMKNIAGTSADDLRLGYSWIAVGELA